MFEILDAIELEQVQIDLIVDEVPVRGIFHIERSDGRLAAKAFPPSRVDAALLGNSVGTDVV